MLWACSQCFLLAADQLCVQHSTGFFLCYATMQLNAACLPPAWPAAFCWHVEDHALCSINYHHMGAPKASAGGPTDPAPVAVLPGDGASSGSAGRPWRCLRCCWPPTADTLPALPSSLTLLHPPPCVLCPAGVVRHSILSHRCPGGRHARRAAPPVCRKPPSAVSACHHAQPRRAQGDCGGWDCTVLKLCTALACLRLCDLLMRRQRASAGPLLARHAPS